MMTIDPQIFIRQTDLANPEKLQNRILIVGAGGIGSWASLALLKMGCTQVDVIDFDVVETHNAGSQLYGSWDEGKTKIDALADKLRLLTETQPGKKLLEINENNVHSIVKDYDIVVSAVDSIDVRKILFNALKGSQKRFLDGRMAGNAIEIYAVPLSDQNKVSLYEETLFSEDEAIHVECSSRAVIYNCFVIAGLMADIIAQWSNNQEVPAELIVDLTNFTLFN